MSLSFPVLCSLGTYCVLLRLHLSSFIIVNNSGVCSVVLMYSHGIMVLEHRTERPTEPLCIDVISE